MLNSSGTCDGCGGRVTNTDDRTGCSLTTLAAVHDKTCPGHPTHPDTPKG